MKRFLVLLLLLAVPVSATVDVQLDGEELPSLIQVQPGDALDLRIVVGANTTVENSDVEADLELIEKMAEFYLLVDYKHYPQRYIKDIGYIFPQTLPAGLYDVTYTVEYRDATGEHTKEEVIKLDVPPRDVKSRVLGWLMRTLPYDVAFEFVNYFSPPQLPEYDKGLTQEDLNRLGFRGATYTVLNEETNQQPEQGNSSQVDQTVTRYTVIHKGEEHTVTKVHMQLTSETGMNFVHVEETISKELAQRAQNVSSPEQFQIIDEDPIVKWRFQNMPPEESADIAYVAEGEADAPAPTTAVNGNRPGTLAYIVRYTLRYWYVLALLLVAALAGGITYVVKRRE